MTNEKVIKDSKTITIEQLLKQEPNHKTYLFSFNYKIIDKNYKSLDNVLEYIGWKVVEEDKNIIGEYNDLKAYKNVKIVPI